MNTPRLKPLTPTIEMLIAYAHRFGVRIGIAMCFHLAYPNRQIEAIVKRQIIKVKACTSPNACLPTGKQAPQKTAHKSSSHTALVLVERFISLIYICDNILELTIVIPAPVAKASTKPSLAFPLNQSFKSYLNAKGVKFGIKLFSVTMPALSVTKLF